jgi:hypothetical protein
MFRLFSVAPGAEGQGLERRCCFKALTEKVF